MKGKTRTKYLSQLQKYRKYRKYKQRKTKRQQHGAFLNRYDFAYVGRDTVNQAMKGLNMLTLKLINQTSKEVDKITEARIRQVLNDGWQQIQKKLHHKKYEELLKTFTKHHSDYWEILANKSFLRSKRKYQN